MEKNNKIKNKVIETYAEDMAKVIEDDKSGLIKKIIHEEERHEIEKKNLSPQSKKNQFFMFVGFLLLFLALTTLFFFVFKTDVNTVPVEKQFVPIIFNDQSSFLEVSTFNKDRIAQTVLNQVNTTKVKTSGVEGIYLTENKQILGLRRFISLIKSSFAPSSNTFFVDDNFLMGVANTGNNDFFILLKVRSIADIFDALRAWEKKMFFDLHGFFGVDLSADTKYLLTKDFQDDIVENKNARVLLDNENKIVMMYILANDTSVIITNTKSAGEEIMLRLAAGQVKK